MRGKFPYIYFQSCPPSHPNVSKQYLVFQVRTIILSSLLYFCFLALPLHRDFITQSHPNISVLQSVQNIKLSDAPVLLSIMHYKLSLLLYRLFYFGNLPTAQKLFLQSYSNERNIE